MAKDILGKMIAVYLFSFFTVNAFRSYLMDKTIKCLNRADIGDQMDHLKLTQTSTSRSNIYMNLDITDDAFICQDNVTWYFNDLCQDKVIRHTPCRLKNGALVQL